MNHPLDPRKSRFQPDHEAADALEAGREVWLEQTLTAAHLFRRMLTNGAHLGECCGTLAQLATKLGYDGSQAMNMAWLGYALEGCEGLEAAVRAKKLTLPKAYEIGKIYQRPELLLDEDDWVHTARFHRLSALRRLVRKRLETMRQDVKKTTTVTLELGQPAKDDFDACRRIASGKAR